METSSEGVWGAVQQHLRSTLSAETFDLWFAPLRLGEMDQTTLVVQVPDEFCGIWLNDNYASLMQEAVGLVLGRPLEIRFEVRSSVCAEPTLVELSHSRSKLTQQIAPCSKSNQGLGFNPKNRFETFVVGENNSFAHAAALAVAESPGKAYNPLFVYGGVGLGKTHLLHAIGQHAAARRQRGRVAYMSSEQFTNAYIEAIQNNQLGHFRKACRQADVLLIDDVQFLAGKERIQEEFFHTFNALHESHKQIVLTCDRPVGALQNLEQRLGSRFEWGLVTDLQPPDGEMRLAILRKKVLLMGVELPPDIIAFLADRIRTNIRRLEGALNRVASYASLTGAKLSINLVEDLLREILHEEGHQAISIEMIQKKVAEHFDIRVADMTSRRRPENIVFPRQIAMFFSRQLTDNSLNTIGEAFGGRDHGTVLHACRLVQERMDVDSHVRQVVGHLELKLSH
jgi:chromosomal replication initiator protein